MKNLFALDKNSNLIHIKSVEKELKEKFSCCNCGNELIARKGKIKAHHFSHKAEGNCSYESYLHKVSKLKFFNEYTNCLRTEKPFYLDFKTEITCNSCIEIKNIEIQCRLTDKIQPFDLTKWFDIVAIEKGVNGLIADILLKSSTKGDEILIEFAVSHKCEQEKIDSGFRIVEIQLEDESDLEFIENRHIKFSDKKISLFNFNFNHKIDKFRNPSICKEKFEFFSVLNDNKTTKFEMPMSKIIANIKTKKYKHFQVLEKQDEEYTGEDFIRLVKDYAFKEKSFKNCYSCRFSTKNSSYYAEYDLFCKRMRWELPNSNIGRNCDKYWILQSAYRLN